jgi:predicted DNA-binding transcriptional regulator YafY
LEVSVKTAARDVDCLRDEWELPIGYDDKGHGFYFTEKVDRLPWVPVTEAELFAVCISSKVLELYHGMPFQRPLELAFAKMTRSLDDEEKFMPNPGPRLASEFNDFKAVLDMARRQV